MILFMEICLLFVGVVHVNSVTMESQNHYLDSAKIMAKRISVMFNNLEHLSPQTSMDNYKIDMVLALKNIISQLEVYDRPKDLFNDYLKTYVFQDTGKRRKHEFAEQTLLHLSSTIFDRYQSLNESVGKMWTVGSGRELFRNITSMEIENLDLLHRHMGDIFDEHEAFRISKNRQTGFKPDSCHDTDKLAQYMIYELYSTLISIQLKALTLNVFYFQSEYMEQAVLKRRFPRDELKKNIMNSVSSMEKYLTESYNVMLPMIFVCTREIENCDARNFKRDENFIELERVFQLIVYPKGNWRSQESCGGTCSKISGETNGENRCYDGYCASCEGEIRDCWEERVITHCRSDEKSSRRYEWFETYENVYNDGIHERLEGLKEKYGTIQHESHDGTRLQGKSNCTNGYKIVREKLKGFAHMGRAYLIEGCAYCICTCEETTDISKKSVFIISSRMANADISEKMVVVGVRFLKVDRIIYTQIQQGRLMSGGRIDHLNNKWKPIDALNRIEVNDKLKRYGKNKAGNSTLSNDFIVISNRMKQINLDDLNCPSDNHVVTGIGLKISETTKNPKRITLSIRCHRVNFENANLILSETQSLTINNEQPHPNQAEIYGMPPDRVKDEHLAQPNTGKYVEFRMSDKLLDAGQSVIPWLDAQNVTTVSGVPLSGVGIHHRSAPKSGGFLAFRLFSIDYSKLL